MISHQAIIRLTSHFPETPVSMRNLEAVWQETEKDEEKLVRLSYEQILDEESKEKEPEIMTFRIGSDGTVRRVSVKRPKSAVRMEFEEGKTCYASYPTPAGTIDVKIRTDSVEGELKEGSIFAKVLYEVLLGGESQGRIRLLIEVRPADAGTF